MTAFLFIVAIVIFVIVDLAIRFYMTKATKEKLRKQWREALTNDLKLDFSHESKTLKRVEVEDPKARILAVDDEEIILDSFRKILVLNGYSVDTVETGQEALGLIQKHNYDFVFTDLKMPQMSGVDVCKGVKQLRPDIDVIIITGYASVDTAVETMKFGAMDYVEKPFTEDELLAMVEKFLIRRNDRIRKEMKSRVHITNLENPGFEETVDFFIPGGVFIAKGHSWAAIADDGTVKAGLDDFAKKTIGKIEGIEMPNLGMEVKQGQPLFTVKQGTRSIPFMAPLSGKVTKINKNIASHPEALDSTPYDQNWICQMDATALDDELSKLHIGQSAVNYFNDEINKLSLYIKDNVSSTMDENAIPADGKVHIGELAALKEKDLNIIVNDFFTF